MKQGSSSAREHWRPIIAKLRRSGLSVADFCRRERLAVSSVFAWKRRLAGLSEWAPTFIPVRLGAESASPPEQGLPAREGGIELHLAPGRHIVLRPGFDRQTLAAALAVLEGSDPIREER